LRNNKQIVRIKQLLLKPLPKGVLKYRYSFNTTDIGALHQKAYKQNEINLPQPFKSVYNFYTLLFWFLFLAWKLTWKIWRKKSKELYHTKQIHPLKQLRDLLKLSFVFTSLPVMYYRLNLYNYKSADWHTFIFTHELPGWHKMMSPKISLQTKTLLSNKNLFAQYMGKIGVPVITDCTILQRQKITAQQLFLKSSLFIKPVDGSKQIDNYPMYYDAQTSSYQLMINKDKSLINEMEIMEFINDLLTRKSYLFQPLLQNHPNTQVLTEIKDLITIRLVTINKAEEFKAISAVLEIPLRNHTKNYCILPIDMESGTVKHFDENEFKLPLFDTIDFNLLKDYKLPRWKEVKDCGLHAHQQMPDVFSVGWDVAITTNGVVLIEGNFNWDVSPHQKNGPTLIQNFA
jgi:hypothetical protein